MAHTEVPHFMIPKFTEEETDRLEHHLTIPEEAVDERFVAGTLRPLENEKRKQFFSTDTGAYDAMNLIQAYFNMETRRPGHAIWFPPVGPGPGNSEGLSLFQKSPSQKS